MPRLIHKITQEEPPRPRKINPAIPRDLETIVLKAIARDADRRYQTARELHNDFGRPVQAEAEFIYRRLASQAAWHEPTMTRPKPAGQPATWTRTPAR
jgi:hypothetical protein